MDLTSLRVVALAGGIGAARFLRGLVRVVDPARLTVVANTGDDIRLHGLHVSPDLDTITYTLGGGVHPEQGWGRAGETTAVAAELADRYGRASWFTLGDRDLATHLVRSEALAAGEPLSAVTTRIAEAWDLPFALLPMSDDRVTTRIRTTDGRDLHFQRWWVGERAGPDVAEVVLDRVVLCPSNPVVSIGPILAVPGIRDALTGTDVVGVSPIVGGRVVRGMADRLLPAVGCEVSAGAVARRYGGVLSAWVLDDVDAGEAAAAGVPTAVTDTVMRDLDVAVALARTTVEHGLAVAGTRTRR